ncbi:hypothetical protein CXB51_021558 [Gossypium anomalum]|uniref:Serine/threonine-protein phosphatase 4 regulatory subunit 3-like central domain-containing protein n=1 Tax=Gossypium anomalum TaxID=47600 RepID=A0A8J5YMS5_9ROSI|nr:hypothetical protein CXB51_021558 [Gossypium anomalum]
MMLIFLMCNTISFFLKEHVIFNEAIPIKNPLALSKIHQTYRVGYLKDVVLARVLDETTTTIEFFTILITNVCNLLKSSQHTRRLLCSSRLGINSCCDYDTINLPETFMIAYISDNKELSTILLFFLEKRNESDFTCMLLSLKPSPVFYVSQLPNEKETIYGALDKWVAWETEFPLIAVAKALQIFKKRSQWLRVIQVYSVYWYSCFVFSSF